MEHFSNLTPHLGFFQKYIRELEEIEGDFR